MRLQTKHMVILAATAAAILSGPSAALPPPAVEEAEWTVMVFLNADNDLEGFGLQDFLEMSSVGSTGDVNIVVQMDRSPKHAVWPTDGDWHQTLRFYVEKGTLPLPSEALQDLGEVNMGDQSVLADFVAWARAEFPARRNMLVIWDHGDGWRLTDVVPIEAMVAEIRQYRAERILEQFPNRDRILLSGDGSLPPVLPLDVATNGAVRASSIDETSGGDKLYNREVQDGLAGVLAGDRLEVIGFDACLMAMIETGYALRDVADILVASEELEPGAGWDYSVWLKALVANPTMDGRDLASTVVDAYRSAYEYKMRDTTLSAVDLSRFETLTGELSAIAGTLRSDLAMMAKAVGAARSEAWPYAPGYGLHGIDLGRWLRRLQTHAQYPKLSGEIDVALATLASSVIANYVGPGRGGPYGSEGLAIYFPESGFLFEHDPDSDGYRPDAQFPVAFVEDHQWDDFLRDYYAAGN